MNRGTRFKLMAWLWIACLLFPFCKMFSAERTVRQIVTEKKTNPDSIALSIPQEATLNSYVLVSYLKQSLHSQDELIRAIYTWITQNIQYNIYATYISQNTEIKEEEEVQTILKTREGNCKQYSLLFKAMAEKAGIKVFIIDGYNKREAVLLPDAHQWCAAEINEQWWLFDSTWGAGYVDNYKFIPDPNYRYFMLRPEDIQNTHMPFDPIWQFKECPLLYQEFDFGVTDSLSTHTFFNWKDSLAIMQQQELLPRLEASYNRMLMNGRKNKLVAYTLQLTQANIQIYRKSRMIETYKQVVSLQDVAADSINHFIRYRNMAFTPRLHNKKIQRMVFVPDSLISLASSLLLTINENELAPQDKEGVIKMKEQIKNVGNFIEKQKEFLTKYFKASKRRRKDMFKAR